jgi:hypothetical protein
VAQVGRGLYDLSNYAKSAATGNYKPMTDRAAYVLSLALVTGLSNAILTAALTGEQPKDWRDLVAFRSGNLDERGDPERFMLPTYAKDIYAYAKNGVLTTLSHKTHPLLSIVSELYNNKDYMGNEIASPDDNIMQRLSSEMGFTVKQFIPFAMQGAFKEHDRDGSMFAQALPFVGVVPAPNAFNQTPAEQLLHQYGAERMPIGARTQEAAKKMEAKTAVYRALRMGNKEKATKLFNEARDN